MGLFAHVPLGELLKLSENRTIGRGCLTWTSIPDENELMLLHAITPFNILLRGGGNYRFLMNIS